MNDRNLNSGHIFEGCCANDCHMVHMVICEWNRLDAVSFYGGDTFVTTN